jgi:hypothetical protein
VFLPSPQNPPDFWDKQLVDSKNQKLSEPISYTKKTFLFRWASWSPFLNSSYTDSFVQKVLGDSPTWLISYIFQLKKDHVAGWFYYQGLLT